MGTEVRPSFSLVISQLSTYDTIRRDSVGAGIVYGCPFTTLYVPPHSPSSPIANTSHHLTTPQPLSRLLHLGLSNLGRNYGIITYALFLGTPVFSYLYAFIAVAHVPDSESNQDGVCRGPASRCWTLTFEVRVRGACKTFIRHEYIITPWQLYTPTRPNGCIYRSTFPRTDPFRY